MKILYIHNEYAKYSGEEHAANELVNLLKEHGHDVKWFKRSSNEISNSFIGKFKAFFLGIYNPFISRKLSKVLNEYKPDIVQVQNLYPLLSSSIFTPIKRRHIPVVMRCPNYRLFCPQGLSLDPSGEICERCWNGNERYCVKLNCMSSFVKSLGYSLRNYYNRISGNIYRGVDVFIVQSDFQKQKFISQGISSEKIEILPGISPIIEKSNPSIIGEYIAFVGRISAEKGIYEFIETAINNPDISFKIAGNIDPNFKKPKRLPSNIEFVGFKKGKELDDFYINSRIIIVPSKWYEGFPNVIVRGMLHKKPIITSNIGAMQSIIDDGINGLLINPNDSNSISKAVKQLYYDTEKCKELGNNGYIKATTLYSRNSIYNILKNIYDTASLLSQRNSK